MRRRHRTVESEERPTLLLMAAGAIAGAAAGLYLGRRYRSLDAFMSDLKLRLEDIKDVWYDDDALEEEDDDDRVLVPGDLEDELDDDSEAEADLDAFDDEDAEEEDDDAWDDELEEDLASVTANGSAAGPPPSEAVARRLEERVLNALRDEPVLGERAIEIAVVGDGVVELTGTVHAIDEGSRAAALARRVPGVSMVLNRIEVRAAGHVDTASVARDITPDATAPPGT